MIAYDDAWILSHRPPRESRDAFVPYDFFVEEECNRDGVIDSGRDHLSYQPRMPVSLPDVRFVAQYSYYHRSGRGDPGTD